MITQERLKYLMTYDPGTGHFTRNVTLPGRFAKAGTIAGGIDSLGYVHIIIDRKRYKVHRLAFLYVTGEFPPHSVDHIDGDPSNNQWSNLRPATHFENMAHTQTRRHNALGIRNVRRTKCGKKFSVRVSHHGVSHHFDTYASIEEAAAVAEKARRALFGVFAGHEKARSQ